MLSKEAFKQKLKDEGWTQVRLARAVGKSPGWLNKIISGTRGMNHKYLYQISLLTGIPPNDLLGWAEPEGGAQKSDDQIMRKSINEIPIQFLEKIVKLGNERLGKEKALAKK